MILNLNSSYILISSISYLGFILKFCTLMIFDENIQIRQIFTKIREVHFLNFCQMLGLVFDVGYLALQPDPNGMPHILYYVKVR